MSGQIWILGATGRSGRGIARRLVESGSTVVLAGRDTKRLPQVAAELGDVQTVSGSYESLLTQVRSAAPAVVVNTIGPFARTSEQVADACPPGTHYVDIGNEWSGVSAILDRHERAVAAGSTLVTGAGFGVLATESVAVRVCDGRPAPARLRVESIPSFASEKGVIGAALAGSMLGGAPDGGRRVENGVLVKSAVAGDRQRVSTPAGDAMTTAALPTGDLIAAWRASNAGSVVSASSAIPSDPFVRAMFPAMSFVLRSSMLRRFAINRLAHVRIPQSDRPREYSWGHATATWADGTTAEGWLRLGDAQQFTESVAAEVARRLAGQQSQTGAYTPAALFGASLATDVGAEFV